MTAMCPLSICSARVSRAPTLVLQPVGHCSTRHFIESRSDMLSPDLIPRETPAAYTYPDYPDRGSILYRVARGLA